MEDFLAVREEIGIIPYIKRGNSFRFVIITSRSNANRWIFPKGQPEADKSSKEVAVNEAFEEAGIIGTIRGKVIKIEVAKKTETVLYKLYPFKISRICRKWPERGIRARKFVKPEKALKKLVFKPYSEALSVFLKRKE